MDNEQRDTMLMEIHGTIHELRPVVHNNAKEIGTLRTKVDGLASSKVKINALWGLSLTAAIGAVAAYFKK